MLNSHAANKQNLTRGMLVDHLEDTYGIRLSKKSCGKLLKGLSYSWKKMRGGYYKKKARAEWVVAHRHHVCLVLDFLHRHDDVFSIWYQDESAFRKNMYQDFAWVKDGDDDHGYDERRRPGVGDGWNVSAYINEKLGVLFSAEGCMGDHVGYVKDSTKGNKSKSGKESKEIFLNGLRDGFDAIRKQEKDKIPVVVIDGAGIHRGLGDNSMRPKQMNLNKKKDGHPETLVQALKRLKLYGDGKSKTREGKNGTMKKMSKDEAIEILLASDAFLSQDMEVEVVAREKEGLVLFLPCAHPVLNPIERFWRLVKNDARQRNGISKEELGELVDWYLLNTDWHELHLQNMFKVSAGYRQLFVGSPFEAIKVPNERKLRRMIEKDKLVTISDLSIDNLVGSPNKKSEVNLQQLHGFFHQLNMIRHTRSILDDSLELWKN